MIFSAVYHRRQWVFGWVPLPPLHWLQNAGLIMHKWWCHAIVNMCTLYTWIWIQCCPHNTSLICTISNWTSCLCGARLLVSFAMLSSSIALGAFALVSSIAFKYCIQVLHSSIALKYCTQVLHFQMYLKHCIGWFCSVEGNLTSGRPIEIWEMEWRSAKIGRPPSPSWSIDLQFCHIFSLKMTLAFVFVMYILYHRVKTKNVQQM